MAILKLTALALFASLIKGVFSSYVSREEEKVYERKSNLRNGLIVDRDLHPNELNGEEGEYVKFRSSYYYGYCIDLKYGSTRNGNSVMLKYCNGSESQYWKIMDDRTIRNYLDDDKCLHLHGSYNKRGSAIEIYDCRDDYIYQQWVYDGAYMYPAGNENKCVDVKSTSYRLHLWNCNSYDNRFVAVPDSPAHSHGNAGGYYGGYYEDHYYGGGYYDDYYYSGGGYNNDDYYYGGYYNGGYGKGYYGRRHGYY